MRDKACFQLHGGVALAQDLVDLLGFDDEVLELDGATEDACLNRVLVEPVQKL